MIRVGTSGFAYADWHPAFYPANLPATRRLEHYAQRFDCVEINSTFYRQPTAQMTANLAGRVPPGFAFAAKVYGGITHDPEFTTNGDLERFATGVAPLVERGVLGAALAQFAHAFRPTRAHVKHLARLRAAWPNLPLVVEFRHADWLTEQALTWLRERDIGFCNVDQPALDGLLPPTVNMTARRSYVRFHGRNATQWYEHREAWERYDYSYTKMELNEWVPRIKSLALEADESYVFFNNHYEAQAVTNAAQLKDMLGLAGVGAGVKEQ